MRQTLIHIPHQLGPLPLFGVGWILLIWIVFSTFILIRAAKTGGARAFWEQVPFTVIVAVLVGVVLPYIEELDADKRPIGLPIRGYGVMLLLGVVSGVAVSAYRAQKQGLNIEVMLSLAFCVFIFGIAGARIFYLIEYWDSFQKDTFAKTVASILNFTEGGLVVYGSVIGGLLSGFFYLRAKKLPVLAIADVTAPGMILGLAIGRIGCLMNGCCHGGVCEQDLPAIQFPLGSPPYMQQLHDGELLGMHIRHLDEHDRKNPVVIEAVTTNGAAEKKGVEAGAEFYLQTASSRLYHSWQKDPTKYQNDVAIALTSADRSKISWTFAELPRESLPVHPAQIYASINGFLLFIVLWLLYPLRWRDGVVFATLITTYPVARIFEEIIRSDETGQLGTGLTVSQWVSAGLLILAIALWIYIQRSAKQLTRKFSVPDPVVKAAR